LNSQKQSPVPAQTKTMNSTVPVPPKKSYEDPMVAAQAQSLPTQQAAPATSESQPEADLNPQMAEKSVPQSQSKEVEGASDQEYFSKSMILNSARRHHQ